MSFFLSPLKQRERLSKTNPVWLNVWKSHLAQIDSLSHTWHMPKDSRSLITLPASKPQEPRGVSFNFPSHRSLPPCQRYSLHLILRALASGSGPTAVHSWSDECILNRLLPPGHQLIRWKSITAVNSTGDREGVEPNKHHTLKKKLKVMCAV